VLKGMDDLEQLLGDAETPAAAAGLSLVALGLARAKLKPPVQKSSVWPLVGAAVLAASAALCLSAVVILGPPTDVAGQVDVNPGMR
jgi:hypothetical protein